MAKYRRIAVPLVFLLALLVIGPKVYDRYFPSGELVLVRGTNVYHRASCVFVKKASPDRIALVDDLARTAQMNYRPCKTCNPQNNAEYVEFLAVLNAKPLDHERAWQMTSKNDDLWKLFTDDTYRDVMLYAYIEGYIPRENMPTEVFSELQLDFFAPRY